MAKKRMDVNWKREIGKDDLKPAVKRFKRYLEDKGLRASTIPMYVCITCCQVLGVLRN